MGKFPPMLLLGMLLLGPWGGRLWAEGFGTAVSGPGPNGLARTPPMGWMSWQVFRCETDCADHPEHCVNEELYRQMASAIASDGYLEVGYATVSIDDCWERLAGRNATSGALLPDPQRFPSGMAALGDFMHEKGVKFGIYSDVGTRTCAGFPASAGHYEQDARTFASWGVDYLKLDGCYSNTTQFASGYPSMGAALQDTHRNITYSCSWPAYLGGNETAKPFAAMVAAGCNTWRNWEDIQCDWGVTSSIIEHWGEYSHDLAAWAGPGHWHDPDMLLLGNGCLTLEEERTQFGLWCIVAAPLIMGNDLRNVTAASRAILMNEDAIAVNQDPLGRMGVRLPPDDNARGNAVQVWARPLHGGDVAVALYNAADGSPGGVDVVQAGAYCANATAVGGGAGFGFSLASCLEAVRADANCSSGFFYFSSSYNGQCKCALDACQKRGPGLAYNIYRVDPSAPPQGATISVNFTEAGFTGSGPVEVYSIWDRKSLGIFAGGAFQATNVSLHDTVLLRLSRPAASTP